MFRERFLAVLTYGLLAFITFSLADFSRAGKPPVSADFTVHEWGTFTSIAGNEGYALNWLPLTGPPELPSFVEHTTYLPKTGLSGTVRMEIPVLYFHSPHAMTLSVQVSFTQGVMTEWYPHASRVEPALASLNNPIRNQKNSDDGSIAWDSVEIDPSFDAALPHENEKSRYYAARETSATPLRIKTPEGDQQEKFLFYRGVSHFPLPISAKLTPDGERLQVKNLAEQAIPNIVLFERRGEKLGYRFGKDVQSEATFDPPALNGTIESLDGDLEAMLVAQGLNADEARAMVQTWSDSWFEEGSRLIYIVPPRFVNTILPLSIHPAPAQTVRVFVGRLELITPATENAIETAFDSADGVILRRYGRFLEPILTEMMRKTSDTDRLKKLSTDLKSARLYVEQN